MYIYVHIYIFIYVYIPNAVGFRRAPVKIKDLKQTIQIPLRELVVGGVAGCQRRHQAISGRLREFGTCKTVSARSWP